ncbi:hypothetical protein BDZ45DRAFT_740271 [Acephala macrosclerotiorum]|nr:hypothetical protein BDZ45DRAFT_740271 [Acephala macrosclerotiorum]
MVAKGISFNPGTNIPSSAGKAILITEGNIWIAIRNAETGKTAFTEIKTASLGVSVEFLQMDLGSFDSIKGATGKFLAYFSRLNISMLNAGIMGSP